MLKLKLSVAGVAVGAKPKARAGAYKLHLFAIISVSGTMFNLAVDDTAYLPSV